MKKRIVLASGNVGKVGEMQAILAGTPFEILPQSQFDVEDAIEDGLTFVENALIKARHAARITGLPAIADDSGIEVDFLNGQPGIYSSRYAGENATSQDNNQKLLQALENVSESERTARFQCVIVFLRHANDPTPVICMGTWQGKIGLTASGTVGFGYDPLFIVDGLNRTAAELTASHKNKISHRGQALQQLVDKFSLKDCID